MTQFTHSFPRLARLVQPTRPEPTDDPTPRRVRFAILLMMAAGVVFATIYASIGMWQMTTAVTGAVLIAGVLSLCARWGCDAHRVGEAGLATLFALLVYSNVVSGGLGDPNLTWFFVLPVAAAATLGPLVAVRWSVVCIAAIVGFWAWEVFGPGLQSQVPAPYRGAQRLANPLAAMAVTGALVTAFIRSHRRALAKADQANEALLAERARLQVLASFDALTALPNRYAFDQALSERLAAGRSVTMLYLDVDRFKDVNDAYGHAMGDKLLIHMARRLRRVTGVGREPTLSQLDASAETPLLARWGGDEFAILLPGADEAKAAELAQRIVHAARFPVMSKGYRLHVGASVGIAFGASGMEASELARNADVALFRVKQRGGDGVEVFESTALESVQRRVLVETCLRTALADKELRLVMQPLTDAEGRMVGAETLLRWRSASLGEVSPAELIPVAERSGQMPTLGAWVLEQACLAATSWPSHLRVSVNVSVAQLAHGDFVDVVERSLRRTRLAASRLELEITESLIADDPRLVDTLRELEGLGVSLALDDFGTGYSSLSTLRTLPVSRVKIDRSFVRAVHQRDEDGAMIRAIVGMAHALGLEVLAEGVEEQAQLEVLARLGCNELQGYLLGRPMEEAEFRRLAGRSERPDDEVAEAARRRALN